MKTKHEPLDYVIAALAGILVVCFTPALGLFLVRTILVGMFWVKDSWLLNTFLSGLYCIAFFFCLGALLMDFESFMQNVVELVKPKQKPKE